MKLIKPNIPNFHLENEHNRIFVAVEIKVLTLEHISKQLTCRLKSVYWPPPTAPHSQYNTLTIHQKLLLLTSKSVRLQSPSIKEKINFQEPEPYFLLVYNVIHTYTSFCRKYMYTLIVTLYFTLLHLYISHYSFETTLGACHILQ